MSETDPIVHCERCHTHIRRSQLDDEGRCPDCQRWARTWDFLGRFQRPRGENPTKGRRRR